MKHFHIGTILSITTGKIVSPRGLSGIQLLVSYMTGQKLMEHQIPRATKVCELYLLKQHPQLKDVVIPGKMTEQQYRQWLKTQIMKFGRNLSVQPLPLGVYQVMNPIKEMAWMRSSSKGIYVIGIDNS